MAQIEGRNPVLEALRGNRKITEILIRQGVAGKRIEKIKSIADRQNIPVKQLSIKEFKSEAESSVPQGIIARGAELQLYGIQELVEVARNDDGEPLLILLDHLKDPHNLGAIIRTAYALGAQGLIYPSDRAAGITPTVLKASAGAAEHLKLAQVANINYTIDKLKEAGFWVAGADAEGASVCYQQDLQGAIALVIGSEGHGLRRLVRQNCDFLVKVPMKNNLNSLNASVAAGVLIYEIIRQRQK